MKRDKQDQHSVVDHLVEGSFPDQVRKIGRKIAKSKVSGAKGTNVVSAPMNDQSPAIRGQLNRIEAKVDELLELVLASSPIG